MLRLPPFGSRMEFAITGRTFPSRVMFVTYRTTLTPPSLIRNGGLSELVAGSQAVDLSTWAGPESIVSSVTIRNSALVEFTRPEGMVQADLMVPDPRYSA